jgi:tRNA/rRNA methyltransferase
MRIILVRPKAPANVGSVARAMKNFGVDELYLVAPQRPLDESAYALATIGRDVLKRAVHCDSVSEAVTGCRLVLGTTARLRRSKSFFVYTPREAAARFPSEGTAVMFGPEDFGLSNDDLDHCQGYIRIPTTEHASLNLAHAVQIVVYEWFVAMQAPRDDRRRDVAPREQLEQLYDHLLRVLYLIGYTDAEREASASRLFRAIFNRAELSEREVAALRGLCSQIEWAAKRDPSSLPGLTRR